MDLALYPYLNGIRTLEFIDDQGPLAPTELKTMKNILIPAFALMGLGLAACTAESTTTPAENTPAEAPKAKTVSFKIDGMT
ncbi:MAG: hypothetical protein ACI841_003739 [Planctomycetota bacterium]|jgi:hypothetical protein